MSDKAKMPKMNLFQINTDKVLDIGAGDFSPATENEKAGFIPHAKSMSYWADAWRRLRKNKVAMVALGVIFALILFAFVGPLFMDYSYSTQVRGEENWPPCWETPSERILEKAESKGITFDSWKHPLGTDKLGRDFLTRLMYGTQVSMIIGLVATLIVLVIGSLYGSISGYAGGMTDTIMMRVVDIIYSIPDVLIVLLLSSSLRTLLTDYINSSTSSFAKFITSLGTNMVGLFITFGLLYWVGMARIIRGQVLMLKQQEFVTAANALGASGSRIVRKHLLPNCIGQIIVTTCLQIPSAIFLESFLSFLGMGVSAPMSSLGSLASEGLDGIYSYAYRLVVPAIILSGMILSFNLFGDGLRDALDPRLKK